MEKYYVPKLSEIHIGFPYRHLSDGLFDDSDESFYGYYNRVYEPTQDYIFGYSQKEWEERVSVKLLDREDIESEGWEHNMTEDNNPNDLYYFNKHSLIHNRITGMCVITMWDEVRPKDYTAFVGTIKNISEFRKIQKMLGIK